LGDVIMALAASNAIARLSNVRIVFQTTPQYREIVSACPFIAEVASSPVEFAVLDARFSAGGTLRDVNLDSAQFGWARVHEVDAFLRFKLGIHAPAELKDLRIEPSDAAQRRVADRLNELDPGRMRVLLHPSDGDPNRTWPQDKWQELATRLRADGYQVLSIGQRGNKNKSNGGMFALDGVMELVDAFDPIETIALMDRSHLLVAADSGPIQLAGTTDIGIVGMYSVVAGRNRLPYRHGQAAWHAVAVSPTCRHHPGYEPLPTSKAFATYLGSGPKGWADNAKFLGEWCVNQDRYACLLREITVDRVMEACRKLLPVTQPDDLPQPRAAGSAAG
jgi:ADP-heptose:LPS heptosyltransferase